MNEYGKLGGLFDSIFNAAMQVAPQLIQQFGGQAQQSGQAKGLAAIRAFCGQVISGLTQIKQQIAQVPAGQRAGFAQLVGQANELAATLSNSAYVYQAKNGQDAQVLRDAKTQAAALVAEIQGLINEQPASVLPNTTQTPVTLPNGQVIYQTAPAPANNDYLLYAAIGLGLILLLKK